MTMPRKKIATTVYLEPEQDRDLKALHRKTRRPVASLIREAIADYLVARRQEIPVEAEDPRQGALDFDPWPDMDTGGFHQ